MSTPASAAVELNRARWSRTTPEQRAAFARRMRLGIVVKELGRHDLDPAMRERIVTAMAPASDLGPASASAARPRSSTGSTTPRWRSSAPSAWAVVGMLSDRVREQVRESRKAQGLSPTVADGRFLAELAADALAQDVTEEAAA
jgi:hypothetical protein